MSYNQVPAASKMVIRVMLAGISSSINVALVLIIVTLAISNKPNTISMCV